MDNKLRLIIWKNSFIIREKNIKLCNFMTNQIGGSGRKLKINYNNNKYVYEEIMDENYYILYSYDKFECVTVIIDKEDRYAEIHDIGNYKTCIKDVDTSVGSPLLKITIKMLQKYKEKLDIKKILITDNSLKKCSNKNIKLSVMLTLLTGNTWYGKYGFKPVDDTLIKYYENNKKIMNTLKLKDIDLIKYLKMTKLDKKVIESCFIENHQSTLLKDYLTRFIKEYDKTCDYFYDFYFTLFIDLGLYDFHHRTFELAI
tara:strand:+ start:564 stop:1334 length:771 start_codon:yes stop_codon:yes gene_type:complete